MLDPSEADYTLAEVAAIMRRSTYQIRTMAARGDIPGAYQLVERGRWAIRRREFDQWRTGLGPRQTDPHRIEPRTRRAAARRGGQS